MPSWDNIDELRLLKIAQDGEADAFGEIYERYGQAIFRFLYSRLDNRHDAEDLTEEVFYRVWRSLPKYKHRGVPFAAFLFRVAHNALIDHYRRYEQQVVGLSLTDNPLHDNYYNPEEITNENNEREEIREALNQLREDYREVLVLRFLSDLSPSETAKVMDRSVGAVRILQHRALAAMRNILNGAQSRKNGKVT